MNQWVSMKITQAMHAIFGILNIRIHHFSNFKNFFFFLNFFTLTDFQANWAENASRIVEFYVCHFGTFPENYKTKQEKREKYNPNNLFWYGISSQFSFWSRLRFSHWIPYNSSAIFYVAKWILPTLKADLLPELVSGDCGCQS